MKTKLLIAALITGVAATSVTAAGFGRGEGAGSFGPRGGIAAMDFATVDANADGSITLEELQALPAAKFAEADTDGDGVLSAEELNAQVTAHGDEPVRVGQPGRREDGARVQPVGTGHGLIRAWR